jgi:hypothetical protein
MPRPTRRGRGIDFNANRVINVVVNKQGSSRDAQGVVRL